jgi:hypothetical protein
VALPLPVLLNACTWRANCADLVRCSPVPINNIVIIGAGCDRCGAVGRASQHDARIRIRFGLERHPSGRGHQDPPIVRSARRPSFCLPWPTDFPMLLLELPHKLKVERADGAERVTEVSPQGAVRTAIRLVVRCPRNWSYGPQAARSLRIF